MKRLVGILSVVAVAAAIVATAASGATLELGFCKKVKLGTGAFGNAGCTTLGGERKYEWTPFGPSQEVPFTTNDEAVNRLSAISVELPANAEHGREILNDLCDLEQSADGSLVGEHEVRNVVLEFKGCNINTTEGGNPPPECNSPGEPKGIVVTRPLSGFFGVVTKGETPAQDQDGMLLHAESGETFLEIDCEAPSFTCQFCGRLPEASTVRGSVIAPFATNKMLGKTKLSYKEASKLPRRQAITGFEGATNEILENKTEQAGQLEENAWGQTLLGLTTILHPAVKVELRDCKPDC